MDLEATLRTLLVFGLFPAWLAAGFADWLCHRASAIERTSGARESRLHFLLHLEIAVPLVLALFFEINALLLAIMTVAVLAHIATSLWDTRRAQPLRYISPLEQHVHSWLEMLPVFALIIVILLHRGAIAAPEWTLQPRVNDLPGGAVATTLILLAAAFALIGEEWFRPVRVSHRRP